MPKIPSAIADIAPDVVTALMSGHSGWDGLVVTNLEASPVGTGQMAHSYRLALDYGERPGGAPDSVIAKVPSADPASRQMALATGAYQREVLFYQRLGDLTEVRAPRCYYAEMADDNCEFVLLLEDMGPAQSVEQIGGCTPDQADLALGQAAALHGGSWGHATLTEQPWLPVEQVWNALAGAIPHGRAVATALRQLPQARTRGRGSSPR